ncbi:hypothetical protein YQE_06928, partial [Dendroctonus ponderosae]
MQVYRMCSCAECYVEAVNWSSVKCINMTSMQILLTIFSEGYWLSGMNLGNGNYYWASTGSPVIYTNWLPNQPDNARLNENHMRGENCIQWGIYNNSKTSAWNDLYCGLTLKYICQQVETCN